MGFLLFHLAWNFYLVPMEPSPCELNSVIKKLLFICILDQKCNVVQN